jgi:hypothetical protein
MKGLGRLKTTVLFVQTKSQRILIGWFEIAELEAHAKTFSAWMELKGNTLRPFDRTVF